MPSPRPYWGNIKGVLIYQWLINHQPPSFPSQVATQSPLVVCNMRAAGWKWGYDSSHPINGQKYLGSKKLPDLKILEISSQGGKNMSPVITRFFIKLDFFCRVKFQPREFSPFYLRPFMVITLLITGSWAHLVWPCHRIPLMWGVQFFQLFFLCVFCTVGPFKSGVSI